MLRRNTLAAILDTPIGAISFQFHFNPEPEVSDLSAAPDDVRRARGMLIARHSDDRAILDMPDLGGAIPAVECLTIEDLRPSFVIVEIDRLRLNKTACRQAGGAAFCWAAETTSGLMPTSISAGMTRIQRCAPLEHDMDLLENRYESSRQAVSLPTASSSPTSRRHLLHNRPPIHP